MRVDNRLQYLRCTRKTTLHGQRIASPQIHVDCLSTLIGLVSRARTKSCETSLGYTLAQVSTADQLEEAEDNHTD